MNLAFVDKLAVQNNRFLHLLVAVHVFLRFFRVQTWKTKYAKKFLPAFKKMTSRENTSEIFWIVKRTEHSKFYAWRKRLNFTMSETKISFAERAIQSLKHIIYRCMEDHGEIFFHSLPQVVKLCLQ